MMNRITHIRLPKMSTIDCAGISIFVGLTLVMIFCGLRPVSIRNQQAAAQLTAAEKDRQHLATLKIAIRTLESDIEAAHTKASTNHERLLPRGALNLRLAQLAAYCESCGLTVIEIKPGDSATSARCISIPIHISGTGSYGSFEGLMKLLYTNCFDLRSSSFKLQATPARSKVTCSFELNLTWLADPKDESQSVPITTASLPQ